MTCALSSRPPPQGANSEQKGAAQGPGTPLTLPSAVPNLPEAAALTEPVQALLLDQLEDLGLDLLPQLPAGTCTRARGGHRTARALMPPPAHRVALTRWVGTGSRPGSSAPTGAAARSRSSSGYAVCS